MTVPKSEPFGAAELAARAIAIERLIAQLAADTPVASERFRTARLVMAYALAHFADAEELGESAAFRTLGRHGHTVGVVHTLRNTRVGGRRLSLEVELSGKSSMELIPSIDASASDRRRTVLVTCLNEAAMEIAFVDRVPNFYTSVADCGRDLARVFEQRFDISPVRPIV